LLDGARRRFRRLRWPLPITLALGGLVVGAISVGVPQVWGNGYSVVNDMLNDKLPLQLLGLVAVAKLVSTTASVGSGANGGILTPTLFMGAAFGALYAHGLHFVHPHLTSQIAAYAVVGMGSFLAATTHAPLTSILLIFEMTLDYEVVLPLMLACVTGHYVARIYRQGESVYTRALKAKGPGDKEEWNLRQITALIRPAGRQLHRDSLLVNALDHPQGAANTAYVLDSQNQLVGMLDIAATKRQLRTQPSGPLALVASYMLPAPPVLTPEMLLGDALDVFIGCHAKQLPVVSGQWSPVLIGEVWRHDLLLALQDRMAERPNRAQAR
jgi:CIC family chloride channel protein